MHDKTGIIKFPIVLLLVFWVGLSSTAVGDFAIGLAEKVNLFRTDSRLS